MTISHLSHFGLTKTHETDTSVIFEGTLAGCKRLAAAHGMEVSRYEGRTIEINGAGGAILESADSRNFCWCWFKQGGFIHRERNSYVLLMPRIIWEQN